MLWLLLSWLLCPPGPADSLVRDLGHPRFQRREVAGRELIRLGERAWPALRRALSAPDPEVRRRAALLLTRAEEQLLARLGPMPMVDALWYQLGKGYLVGHPLRERYWSVLARHGWDGMPWASYCRASEEVVKGWISAGMPEWLIRHVLCQMRRHDFHFAKGCDAAKWYPDPDAADAPKRPAWPEPAMMRAP